MKTPLVLCCALAISVLLTDLESPSTLRAMILPLLDLVLLICLVVWAIGKLGAGRVSGSRDSGGFFSDMSGGDGGGCD